MENDIYENLRKVENAISKNETWFRNLWESNADKYEFQDLAGIIYKSALGGKLPLDRFDKGWQHRTVLHEDYKQAIMEFANLIMGWY